MLSVSGTFPQEQTNVMKNFYGGKIIIALCQSIAQYDIFYIYFDSTPLKKHYFCM